MRDINEFEDEDCEEEEKSSLQTGFTQVPNSVLTDPDLSISARLLYCNLLSFTWNKDFCEPSQKRLGENMGISPRRIRTILKVLVEKGYIDIYRHGYNTTNIYILHIFPQQKTFEYLFKDTFPKKSIAKSRKKAKKRLTQKERNIRTKRKKSSL